MKRTPNISITILVAGLLVAALSFVIPKNKEKYLGDMFWSRKTFASAKYNVVLMGDSRVYRGLSPYVIEKRLSGLKVLNFGYSNGGLNPTMFDAAESKLNKKAKNKVIVLGISANSITSYTKDNNQYLQELTRPKEDVLERLYLNPILYWFSATNPEQLKESFKAADNSSYYLSEYHLNGYVESDKFPADTMEALPSYIKDFTKYKVEQSAIDELFEQIKKWVAEGITVVGYRPPVSHPMVELEDSLGNYNEELIKTGFEAAGGHWVEVEPTEYKTYDGSHLDKPSAERFSEFLAQKISSLLQ